MKKSPQSLPDRGRVGKRGAWPSILFRQFAQRPLAPCHHLARGGKLLVEPGIAMHQLFLWIGMEGAVSLGVIARVTVTP